MLCLCMAASQNKLLSLSVGKLSNVQCSTYMRMGQVEAIACAGALEHRLDQ